MYIMAFVLMFLFGSIGAAFKGDFSGISVIGRVFVGIGTFFFIACILTGFSTNGSGTIFLIALGMIVLGIIMSVTEFF